MAETHGLQGIRTMKKRLQYIRSLSSRTTGVISFLSNVSFLLLAWILLPLESLKWQWVLRNQRTLFPHVDFDALRPLDPLRILIQGFFLIFFSHRGLLKKRQSPDQASGLFTLTRKLCTVGSTYYCAFIEDVRKRVSSGAASLTGSELRIRSGLGSFARILGILLTLAAAALAWLCITQPLSVGNQAIFLIGALILAFFLREIRNRLTLILLILLSSIVSARYMWWRWTETLNSDSVIGLTCSLLLAFAETYCFVVMVLAYFQVVWVLDRKPIPLPADSGTWPAVDVLIPTYNEPLEVVKPTVLGAQSLTWPADKLRISLLDDGTRPEFKAFAEKAGINYITRPKHNHAKAGNINHALESLTGDFVAIFDCDHIPVRGFLEMTMGWMVRDKRIALVQTPHHFYSQDPFERNLGLASTEPVENALFHDFIQKGNDAWNATMFCGSCAVMRRKALDEVGGIAVETVTEDAHTSLKLNRRGWKSAFIGIPLAAGLSTETLSAHVGQRIRWARGMVQIFRLDNPLLGRGLSFGQRMCFLNAMIHFFHGLPRIIFLLAPLPYLLFDIYVIKAPASSILVYVLPHMLLSTLAMSVLHRGHRSPFLGAVYEAILSWYILIPTTVALIAPKFGKFNVTVKGGTVRRKYLDWQIAKPYLVLMALNIAGVAWAAWTSFVDPYASHMTIAINVAWVLYNLVLLGATMAVAVEVVQERQYPRVRVCRPAAVQTDKGTLIAGRLTDFSQKGARVRLAEGAPMSFTVGSHAAVVLEDNGMGYSFPVIVRRIENGWLGLEFVDLSLEDERRLVALTFCRNDIWIKPVPQKMKFFEGTCSLLLMAVRGYHSLWNFLPKFVTKPAGLAAIPLIWLFSFIPRMIRINGPVLEVGRQLRPDQKKPTDK